MATQNTFESLEGEFYWMRAHEPEENPFPKPGQPPSFQWKTQFRPNAESVMKIVDLQSLGVKNQLKKTEDGKQYSINFNRPTEVRSKTKAPVPLDPPKIFKADGVTPLTEFVGNGSKGTLILELYPHKTPNGGKAHAVRFHSAIIKELVAYGGNEVRSATNQGWG